VSAAIGFAFALLVIVQTIEHIAPSRSRSRCIARSSRTVSGIIDCCREVRRGE
jgi:hypothetical protein